MFTSCVPGIWTRLTCVWWFCFKLMPISGNAWVSQKILLTLKVVKIDAKIIISLLLQKVKSTSLMHFVVLISFSFSMSLWSFYVSLIFFLSEHFSLQFSLSLCFSLSLSLSLSLSSYHDFPRIEITNFFTRNRLQFDTVECGKWRKKKNVCKTTLDNWRKNVK